MSAARSGNTRDDKSSMSKESEDLSQKMPAWNNSRLQLRTGTLQEEGNFCLSKKKILTTEHSAFIKEEKKNPGDGVKLGKNSTSPKQEGIQNMSTSSDLHGHLFRWCSS